MSSTDDRSNGNDTLHSVVAVVFLLAAAVITAAQTKPDFSGEWVLNRLVSKLSAGADAVQSGIVRIEHREPVFRYDAEFVSASAPLRYQFELQSDGRDVAATQKGVESVSSLRWDGDILVFTGRIKRPDGDLTIIFRYELFDGGRRLRAVEELRGRGRDQDNVWIFDRK